MKKILLILVLACTCSIAANAQFYFGGTVGFSYTHFKMSAEDKDGSASFKFLPEVGYSFNDRFAAGISLGYIKGLSSLGSFDLTDFKTFASTIASIGSEFDSSDVGNARNIGAFRMSPYFRWTFFRSGKLSLFLDSLIGLNFGSIRTLDGDAVVKTKFTAVEISALPGLSFALTDNVKILAKLGGIGFQHAGINDTVMALNRFGLDANPASIMFGVVYNMSERLGRK